MLKKAINMLFGLLILILIIDPGDLIFHLKTPLFFLIFILWGCTKTLTTIKYRIDFLIIAFVFLLIPIIGIIISVLQNNLSNLAFAMVFLKSFSVMTLLIVVVDQNVPVEKYLNRYCIMLPIVILPIYILFLHSPALIPVVYQYAEQKDLAKLGYRIFYGFKVIMLYYRTSPLLVFPLAYFGYQFVSGKNRLTSLFLVGLYCFTLILSGTRANMLVSVLITAYFIFAYFNRRRNKIYVTLLATCSIVVLLSFLGNLSFKERDKSTDVKAGHFNSYIDLFNEHPQYLLWGQGLGSEFYSSGNKHMVPQTELTYFDLIRIFGLPLMLIIMFIILYPVFYIIQNKKLKKYNYLIIAYGGYLFIAGTNPLLVSSTGMLAIILLYSKISQDRNENLSLHSHV